MEGDSRNIGSLTSNGGLSRLEMFGDLQTLPRTSLMHLQPRMQSMALETGNPLDLTSAIVHELQRSSGQQEWLTWQQHRSSQHQSQHEPPNLPYGGFLPQPQLDTTSNNRQLGRYIPYFNDTGTGMDSSAVVASLPNAMPMSFNNGLDTESLSSAHHLSVYSGPSNLPCDSAPLLNAPHVMDMQQFEHPGGSGGSFSPWIERMMHADVTPTPSPSLCTSTNPTLVQRTGTDVSCVMSHTVELQSCHSSGNQRSSEKSTRSTLYGEQHQEATVEAELCTDDDDMEAAPIDEKRKKRMLSNRASAQRSRQRRQERLDQLEVLTAQLRVEKSALQKKANMAMQLAKKFEEENKQLLKRFEKLSQEFEGKQQQKGLSHVPATAADECASSQQTTCASSAELAGEQPSGDPSSRPEGTLDDGASASSKSGGDEGQVIGMDGSGSSGVNRSSALNGFVRVMEGSPSRLQRPMSTKSAPGISLTGKKRTHSESMEPGRSLSMSLGSHMGYGSAGKGYLLPHSSSHPQLLNPMMHIVGRSFSMPEPSLHCFSQEVCYPSGPVDSAVAERDERERIDCLVEEQWLESFAEYLH